MSFYRSLVVGVVTFALSAAVFANEENSNHLQMQQANAQSTEGTASNIDASAATQTQGKININKATMKELMAVKGLSRVKAKNIITYRKKHGDFKSLDDLRLVKGFKKMSDANLKIVEDQLSIQ